MNRWSILLVCGVLLLSACKDEKSSDSEKTVTALGTFCHGLTVDGEETTFVLRLGSGSAMKTLSANTGECSIDLGQGCESIPAGQALPFEILAEDGTSVTTGTVDLTRDLDYVFVLDLDEAGDFAVSMGEVQGDYRCSAMSCDLGLYNTQTCASADPCGWAADGYCDELCGEIVTDPFDDSADCTVDCEAIATYSDCILCNCEDPMATCLANTDCVYLLSCAAECADDTCVSDCGTTYPDGITDLSALIDCSDASYCDDYPN